MAHVDDMQQRLLEIVLALHPSVQPRPGKNGGMDYYVGDQFLCALRAGEDGVELYLMPLYMSRRIELDFAERLEQWQSGNKRCLMFTKERPMDWDLVAEVLRAHAAL